MKRNVIISGIAVLVVSTGIIGYMVSAQEPQEESIKAKAETVLVPEAQEAKVNESTPTEEVITEAPVPVKQQPSSPSAPAPSVSREQVSTVTTSTVLANWNPKETGLMISTANIISLIMKTYDGSPEAFTDKNVESISITCINRIKAMNKEEAIQFVYGDSCL